MIKANKNFKTKRRKMIPPLVFFTLPVDIEPIHPSVPDGSIVAILQVLARTKEQHRPISSVPWKWIRHFRVSPDTSTEREAFPCAPPLSCLLNYWIPFHCCPSNLLQRHPFPSISMEWQWDVSMNFFSSVCLASSRIADGRRVRRRWMLDGWLVWLAPWAASAPIERRWTRTKWSL